jgi:hypothetical protein
VSCRQATDQIEPALPRGYSEKSLPTAVPHLPQPVRC